MYLLYADDSGVSSDPSVKYSVLAGFSTFENQTFWIQKAVDEIMLKHTGRADLELHASPIRSGKGIWRGFPTYSWLICFRKMKKVSLIILLAFVCLAQLLAKDYPYLVYGEDGIYTYNIEDREFCLKEFFKYKERQRPYYRYFSDKDSVVMYDSEFDNYYCMFYRLNRQSHEFEEIYKIGRYNPYKECLVSVKDFIYMVERNLTKDTDSYWLTKRSFCSPDVIEKLSWRFLIQSITKKLVSRMKLWMSAFFLRSI